MYAEFHWARKLVITRCEIGQYLFLHLRCIACHCKLPSVYNTRMSQNTHANYRFILKYLITTAVSITFTHMSLCAVKQQILRFQSPTTGLFPADLSQPHSSEAHVRDSIYCAVAVWSLAQAYKYITQVK